MHHSAAMCSDRCQLQHCSTSSKLFADRREEGASTTLLSTHHKELLLIAQTHLGQYHVWQLCTHWSTVAGCRAFIMKPAEQSARTGFQHWLRDTKMAPSSVTWTLVSVREKQTWRGQA